MSNTNKNVLGENIRRIRTEQGKTLDDIAALVGVSKQTIQRYETNAISNVPSDKIELIAKALNTSPGALMGWIEKYSDEHAITSAKITSDLRLLTYASKLMNLSPEHKEQVFNIIEALSNLESELKKK